MLSNSGGGVLISPLCVFDVTGECGALYSRVPDADALARGAKNKGSAEMLAEEGNLTHKEPEKTSLTWLMP